MIGPLIALGAGVVLSAALPPTGVWPALIALAVLFGMVSHAERPGEAFGLGAWFALGFFALYVLWVPMSFALPSMLGPFFWLLYPLLLLALAAIWGLVTWAAHLVAGRGGSVLFVLPVFWVLMEWARSQGYFAFPWGSLGYTWLETPVAQLADTVGVTGLSLLSAACASALAAPFAARSERRLRRDGPAVGRIVAPIVAVLVLGGSWWWGSTKLDAPLGPLEATALLVQPNVDPFARAVSARQELAIHTTITEIGLSAMAAPPDLVIWPEGALLGLEIEGNVGAEVRSQVQASAPASEFILGARGRSADRSYNSAFAIASAAVVDRYDKHVLVPFGERWPLLEEAAPLYRGVFGALGLPMLQNTSPGVGPVPLATGLGPVALLVCYESVFPEVTNAMVAAGARVLITITNDAWFARGNGARQHFDMGRFRAIETRRFLLRSANDGITGLVDPFGRVVAQLPRGVASQLPVRFGLRDEITPFVRYGGFLPGGLAGLGLLVSVGAALRRRT
ncbi:MAG: apolipoprotein N-acyltransferase [Trueperaceae bacterium]|nr:apolipoprotein N-acyltransferase [Trueperaceae bacterium]